MATPQRRERLRRVLARRQDNVTVVLDNVHDAHNASAVLRSADGFGVGRIALLYTDHPMPSLSKGVSGHTRKWMTIERYDDAEACLAALRARGERVVATHAAAGSPSYLALDWTGPVAIVLGNEHEGCSPAMRAAADTAVAIPMQGMAQSFNVSVAAAIVRRSCAASGCSGGPTKSIGARRRRRSIGSGSRARSSTRTPDRPRNWQTKAAPTP